ncbi:hypothetical protein ACP70R_013309 [Stipagrostis hirtigluma subsp. patula]
MEPTGSSREDQCSSSEGHTGGTDEQPPNLSSVTAGAQGPLLGSGSSHEDPCNSSEGHTSGTDDQPSNLSSITADAQGPLHGSGCLGLEPSGVDAPLNYVEVQKEWLSDPPEATQELPYMAVCKGDPSAKLYQEGSSSSRYHGLLAEDEDEDNLPPVVRDATQEVLGRQTEYDRQFPSETHLEIRERRKKAHLPRFSEVKISKKGFPMVGSHTPNSSDKMWVGINGFGRIGRLVARLMLQKHRKQLELIAINDPSHPSVSAGDMENFMVGVPPGDFPDVKVFHLKYVLAVYALNAVTREFIFTCSFLSHMPIFDLRKPEDIPWGMIGVDYVIESTGLFTDRDAAAAHLKRGAKKVVICALSKDAPVFVYGANQDKYTADVAILSIADCATSCIAPLAKIIDEIFGISEGLLTIRQPLPANLEDADGPSCSEWREGATALGSVLPNLAGKFSGKVYHVRDAELSYVEMNLKLCDESADYGRVQIAVRDEMCKHKLERTIAYMDGVSELTGYAQDTRSCLFDVDAGGTLEDSTIRIIARFNNGYGYSMRCIDLILYMAGVQ